MPMCPQVILVGGTLAYISKLATVCAACGRPKKAAPQVHGQAVLFQDASGFQIKARVKRSSTTEAVQPHHTAEVHSEGAADVADGAVPSERLPLRRAGSEVQPADRD